MSVGKVPDLTPGKLWDNFRKLSMSLYLNLRIIIMILSTYLNGTFWYFQSLQWEWADS